MLSFHRFHFTKVVALNCPNGADVPFITYSTNHFHLAFITLPLLSIAFLKLSLLPAHLRLSLAAHPSATDTATN